MGAAAYKLGIEKRDEIWEENDFNIGMVKMGLHFCLQKQSFFSLKQKNCKKTPSSYMCR